MTDLDVRIVDLESMRVAAALGFGTNPEMQAWGSILNFAHSHGLDPWDHTHRFFGFNNPDPSTGEGTYGYEQWMTVGDDVRTTDPLEEKELTGGRYAMVHTTGLESISDTWKNLAEWCEEHGYQIAHDRESCLKEVLTPIDQPTDRWELNLYLAVE